MVMSYLVMIMQIITTNIARTATPTSASTLHCLLSTGAQAPGTLPGMSRAVARTRVTTARACNEAGC